MDVHSSFQHPLVGRYCKDSLLNGILSDHNRIKTWRSLWTWLAEAEIELGLTCIKQNQVDAMKKALTNIDWVYAAQVEKDLRHDVMAHVHAFEKAAPAASGIIHLGATSAFIQDNADLIIIKEALDKVALVRLSQCVAELGLFAAKYKDTVTVGRTHYQPASLTTVGKRACIWAQDLIMALTQLIQFRDSFKFRGAQSATGSQATFLCLFDNDHKKVLEMNRRIAVKAGFPADRVFQITGQTYTRQQDAQLMACFAFVATSVNKMCVDIRLLQSCGEVMEPFEDKQVGSSAMPYKRNPMRCERVCGFARSLKNLLPSALDTAETQGFERTLDDSSCRRLFIPEGFLILEAMLTTTLNILQGMRVCESVVAENVQKELPFLALEQVMMLMTKKGANRQNVHESIRKISMQAHKQREEGEESVVVDLISNDPILCGQKEALQSFIKKPKLLIGRCPEQVTDFVEKELKPIIKRYLPSASKKQELTI